MAAAADEYHWNLTALAEALGFHRDTLRTHINSAGIEPAGKRGNALLYDLKQVAQVMFASSSVSKGGSIDPDKLDPKGRLDWFKSETERLRFQTETRQLIPDGEHRDSLAATLKVVSGFFDSLPDKMERTRLFTPEQLTQLEKECDSLRLQLKAELMEIAD